MIGLVALVACQNGTDSNSGNSGPMKAIATIPFSDTVRIPDSTAWSTATDSGHGGFSCTGTTCHDTLSLKDPLGSQVANIQLWILGIHLETLHFTQSGSNPNLIALDTFHIDSLGLKLLESFDSLRSIKGDSLAKAGPLASDLIAYYSSLLLAGNTTFKGFPSTLPAGLNPSTVQDTLVLLALQAGKSPVQIASLNLGLDTGSIRTIAAILVQANLLKSTDTLDWFHPVRVSAAVSIASSLTAGGGAVNVNGAFSWNPGSSVTLSRITVRTPIPGDSSTVQLSYQFNIGKTDTLWSLSSNLTLQAKSSASVGWDTLLIILSTDSTHSVTARVPIQVVAKDVTPPALTLLSPALDTATVPNSTASFVVKALATDSGSGMDSLKIGTKTFRTAEAIADTLWDTLSLVVGANVATVQAWDHVGNTSTATVTITRAPAPVNTKAPTIIHVSPQQDTETVPWSTKSATLSWTINGDTTISTVTLNGHPIAGSTASAGLYQTSMPLTVGLNVFPLSAVDAYGMVAYDTLRITRQADTSHPLVSRGSGAQDTVLVKSQSTFSPIWTVTDNALDSVTINGIAVTVGNGNTYSAPVPLAGDSLWITLVAVDSSENRTRDSIKVRRLGPPTITPAGGNFSASQTPTAAITSIWPGAALFYSSDKNAWTPYTTGLSIATSQILYARATLGNATSEIDSAIFLFAPSLSPTSGPYNAGQVISIQAPGAAIEDSLSTGGGWVAYQAVQLVSSTEVFARTRLGGAVSALASATYALPPKVSPAGGTFPDTVSVHAADPGADAFQWSLDGTDWKTAPADTLRSSGTLYVRSVIGGISSQPDTETFQISHDSSLLSLDVSGSKLGTGWDSSVNPGTLHLDSLPGFLQQLTVKAVAKDPFATIAVNGGSSGVVNLENDTATVAVVVTNGPSTHTYSIHLFGRKLDTFTDSRDGHAYRAELFGTQWWMADNLKSGSADGTYTWSQAMALPGSCDSTSCQNLIQSPHQGVCPAGWHVPVKMEWSALFVETMPSGATDSAIALKTDTGWTTTSGTPEVYLPPNYPCNVNEGGTCVTTTSSNGTNQYASFIAPFGNATVQHSTSPSAGSTTYRYANFWVAGETSATCGETEGFDYQNCSKMNFPVVGPTPLAPSFIPTALRCVKD